MLFRSRRLRDSGIFPKVVLIDTISFCNLRCSMCVHKKMKRKKGVMPLRIFTKIIDEITDIDKNVRVWMVFFGEALLLKRFKPGIFDMVSYAKNKGLKDVVLNTNANLMDKDTSRKLIDSGLDAIYIGIDALKESTYVKLRVGGDYKKVIQNTLDLLALKKELHINKPDVFVQFVEMNINSIEKKDFIDFWNKKGAIVKVRPKVSWAGLIDMPNLIPGNHDRYPCYWAMQTMSITDAGKVVTCAVDLDARFVAGDINKNSLKEIWNGPLKDLRLLHYSGRYNDLPDNCRGCVDWQFARADFYTGRF